MSAVENHWQDGLKEVSRLWLSRLLTQVCRDPSSPLHGCFDRNWWHYRIRDFPSIILQQGGYALWLAGQLQENQREREALQRLAGAAARFWNQRARLRGAFEEYYPWEQGYPPLAFSTLAVMKLTAAGALKPEEVRDGARLACQQLQTRFEAHAANQQVAGLAALCWCRRVFPELVQEAALNSLIVRTLSLQNAEGWYEEYGGPDLGYLSVTIDCLWDLFDATGDHRFLDSIQRAVEWIALFVSALSGRSIGMHNARNTDYVVPYGLFRAALEHRAAAPAAVAACAALYGEATKPTHFLHATDDRYICHYIGQSLMRSVVLLERAGSAAALSAVPCPTPQPPGELLTQSGHFLRCAEPGEALLVTLRKGGLMTWRIGERVMTDFGWIVEMGGRQFITHWWSDEWAHHRDKSGLVITGCLYEHKEPANTPWQHMALRVMSFLFGRRLISALKDRLIFKKPPSAFGFERRVEWAKDQVTVRDQFSGLPVDARLVPAPRSSKRHVASADSAHEEDLHPTSGFVMDRASKTLGPKLEVLTVYRPQ